MSFADHTGEFCSGTGDVIALLGALPDLLEYSESFIDDELVVYIIRDAAGSIKVKGVGIFSKTNNTITRKDTSNSDLSKAVDSKVDNNPATNIVLSSGTHTIKCDLTQQTAFVPAYPVTDGVYFTPHNVHITANNNTVLVADRAYYIPYYLSHGVTISNLHIWCVTADAGATDIRLGLYTIDVANGNPAKLVLELTTDGATTGLKEGATTTIILKAGWYWSAVLSNGVPTIAACVTRSHMLASPIKKTYLSTETYYPLYQDITSGWSGLSADISASTFLTTTVAPAPQLKISI